MSEPGVVNLDIDELASARIVHVLGETQLSGAEHQLLYLLEALTERGLRPELVFFREGIHHDRFAALDVRMHHVHARGRLALDWRRRAGALVRLLEDRPPDILHTWLYEAHLVGLTAVRRWPDTRTVLAHRSGPGLPGERWKQLAMYPARRRIDHAVANSPAGAKIMRRFGVPAERVSVIGNAVPADRVAISRGRESVRRELGLAQDAPVICSLTRPDQTKDLPTLFAAFGAVRAVQPTAELLLVGPTVAKLEAFGTPLPEGARAIGFHEHPADFVNASDVIAVSSCTEGNSNVAAEALMLGMPVATTDTGAHVSLVAHAGGRVVPVRQPSRLAEAILALLREPPARDGVRAAATPHLSVTHVVDATLTLYERLLAGQHVARLASDQPRRREGAPA